MEYKHRRGTCRFVGYVSELGNGIFVGVELDESVGDSGTDGSIQGTRYFECAQGHGQFVVIEQCQKIESPANQIMSNLDSNHSASSVGPSSSSPQPPHQPPHQRNGYPPPTAADIDNNNNTAMMPAVHSTSDHHSKAVQQHPVAGNMSMEFGSSPYGHFVDLNEVDMDSARRTLKRALSRRQSQHDLVRYGVVPENYWSDPLAVALEMAGQQNAVTSQLCNWLPIRPNSTELEQRNIVPINYFVDPLAASRGQKVVKEMISEQLEEFHERRPTLNELQRRNIMPPEFLSPEMEHEEAAKLQLERQQKVRNGLNEKLSHPRRPTITDLGDMHIIPHDYLDNLLEEAVADHKRKPSRIDHVKHRLQQHLPEPVAHTLAETLVDSVQGDDAENDEHHHHHLHHLHNHPYNTTGGSPSSSSSSSTSTSSSTTNTTSSPGTVDDEHEWQISFVWGSDNMAGYVPMHPDTKKDVGKTLERRLSLRPTPFQIESWGIVPPTYFENAVETLFFVVH